MKPLITLLCVVTSLWIGLPCAILGIMGWSWGLMDASPGENQQFGTMCLTVAGVVWLPSILWFRFLAQPDSRTDAE